MGECVSKLDDDAPRRMSSQSVLSQPTQPLKKYKSKLLNPNINKAVIMEEESCVSYSQYSANDSSLVKSSIQFQKNKQNGTPVRQSKAFNVINVTNGRKLHSHCIKNQLKSHEVVLCNETRSDYDQWQFIDAHDQAIENHSMVLLQHKLTNTLLRMTDGVACCVSSHDITDDDYWKIHFLTESKIFLSNSFFQLQHVKTELYLAAQKTKGVMKEHTLVGTQQMPEIWIAEEC